MGLSTDEIVTAWAEKVAGPGWSNRLVWVLIREANGRLRMKAIQPERQTPEMWTVFDVCAEATKTLTAVVLAKEGK